MQPFYITSRLVYDFVPGAIKTITNGKLQTKNETTIKSGIMIIFFSFDVQADTTHLFITPPTLIIAIMHCFQTVRRTMETYIGAIKSTPAKFYIHWQLDILKAVL